MTPQVSHYGSEGLVEVLILPKGNSNTIVRNNLTNTFKYCLNLILE